MRLTTAIDRRRRIRRAVRHIETRIETESDARPTLAELADIACLSPFHFLRLYRHAVGEAPLATVLRLRLTAARRRLAENPTLTVTEAAFDHGYDSAQSFARAFRRQFGVQPSARVAEPTPHAAVTISLAQLPILRAQTLAVERGWDGAADTFDEMIGHFDVAVVPRRGQDMCGVLSPDGDFRQACAIENALTANALRLASRELHGGWHIRVAGQTHAVFRRRRSDAALTQWRCEDAPIVMRYGNDPAYCTRDEQRIALYLPLAPDAPIEAIARSL